MTKYFSVKYLFTRGIEEVEGERSQRFPGFILVKGQLLSIGKNVFPTSTAAASKAIEMREKEILRLRAKLAELEALEF